jgi:hypothetical protein
MAAGPRRAGPLCRAAFVAGAIGLLSGCLDASVAGPGPDDDIRVTYVGTSIADSVQAAVTGVRFFVSEAGSEDRPLSGLRAFFQAQGEGCGEALEPSARSDENGFVETTWLMGEIVGDCELRVRVLNAAGILLAFHDVAAEVIHGQADILGWIEPGESVAARGSLGLVGPAEAAFDRLANEVPWGFRVLSGPAAVVGGELGSAGARTLVPAGGTGPGRVVVESRWGDVVTLDLCVQDVGGDRDLRLHWTPDGADPPACAG